MNDVVLGSILSERDHKVVMSAVRRLERALKRSEETIFKSPECTQKYLALRLSHLTHEVFAIMWLDNRNRLIHWDELFRGTIDGANVYPREVVKSALHHNAAAALLVHNHPSGVIEASGADRRITERLQQSLDLVGIRVLDHIIVGNGQQLSFAEKGYL